MRRPLHLLISLMSVQANAFPVFRPDVATSESEPLIQTAELRDGPSLKDMIQKISDERIDSATKPKADIGGINVNINGLESTGGPDGVRLSDAYDVVAIINKSRDAQTLTLHRFYTDSGQRKAMKPEVFKISSGQEKWTSCAPNKKGDAMETRWMGTPTGFFNPYLIHADHHSGQYDDATMFKAVFFNKVGIATHQGVVTSARASHGCIRMDALGSAKVMSAVMQTGKTPTSVDSWAFNGECPSADELKDEKLAACKAAAEKRGQVWKMLATKSIEEGTKNGLFYSADQQIPDVNQAGKLARGDDGQPKMKTNAYKALYVVQCVDKMGADCSMTANSAAFKNKPDCTNVQPAEQVVAKNAPGARPGKQAPANDDPVGNFFESIFGGGQAGKPAPRQRTTGL